MPDYLIPYPKKLKKRAGFFKNSGDMKIFFSSKNKEIAQMITGDWNGELKHSITKDDNCITITSDSYKPYIRPIIKHDEGYVLEILPDIIRINGNTYNGLLYGYVTLSEIISRNEKLPCITIDDYPDLGMRGIHLDLKGVFPKFDYLKKLIKTLTGYKINTILMEYEDKFPYQKHKQISSPEAFTPKELKELLAYAEKRGIEVIPLLQCMDHTEYILKHDSLAHLGENGTRQMLCPRNPKTLETFKDMAEEILDYHPNAKYFHVGADEAQMLGDCEICSSYVEKHGKAGLFADFIKEIAEYLTSKGIKPIIWDDMLYKFKDFDLFRDVPGGITLCVWDYGATEEDTAYTRWGHKIYMSKEWINIDPTKMLGFEWGIGEWLENLPEDEYNFISKYKGGNFPIGGHPFPWIRKYIESGYEVIGASAVKGGGSDAQNSVFGHSNRIYKNSALWSKKAFDEGVTGVIGTAWSRFDTPLPPTSFIGSNMYNLIAAAENSWNKDSEKNEFDARFSIGYLGSETKVVKALKYMEDSLERREIPLAYAAKELLEDSFDKVKSNRDYIEILINCAEFAFVFLKTWQTILFTSPLAYYTYQEDALRHETNVDALRRLNETRVLLENWREKAYELYPQFMSLSEAEEYIETKVFGLLSSIDDISAKFKTD